ncbi:alanine racemase [Pengzhenrongella frigida]|uniref:Amino acid deaminase/aldolase n=1 Tax=Pengzhenrongella frigida TaxID=1259133 RepID=A0A4Q5N5B2_9MICO|nr:alanine racemase [Cellulomonas sp. HLT2-17]RYV51271.1 amino acid deaminase/aldolase [Cellulomonas sp. HLT2-17]
MSDRLSAATAGLPAPIVVVDLAALDANAADLVRRAGGVPVRVASKSVRVRWVLDRVLARPGFAGLLAFTLREALWLVGHGARDVLVSYPTVDTGSLARLAADPVAAAAITLMVDDVAQVALAARAAQTGGQRVLLCLDVDASLRVGVGPRAVHLGVRRSPVHEPAQAAALATLVARRDGVVVRGVMFYEAQVAGLPDTSWAARLVKRASVADLAVRRGRVVDAVQQAIGGPLALVNSGGTGSIESTVSDPVVTEVSAGSGLFAPALFDHYRSFAARPAAYFGLDVVRRPAPGYVTAFGGGFVASGPAGRSRLPVPIDPRLRLTRREGAGEVQTPLRVTGRPTPPRVRPRRAAGAPPADATRGPAIGDRVWFRHAKAGELMEHVPEIQVLHPDGTTTATATYRGESPPPH